MGLVSLFADMTYEGARSIIGPFLQVLGASGTIVGIVSGAGELIGYTLRIVSGYFSDRTKKYWTITILGFAINLLAVPALALAGRWEIAAGFIIAERLGKAIRTPARDAMLSYANQRLGQGWGFGLHEAMDQIGAITGPLFIAWTLSAGTKYQDAFLWLLAPALLALTSLGVSRVLYPKPQDLTVKTNIPGTSKFPHQYWIYVVAASLIAIGYADFPLIAFHLQKDHAGISIPLFYALAMGVDGAAALVFGRLYDRAGLPVLIFAFLLSAFFAPFVFLSKWPIAGIVLWGIGMGSQESILRASIADMVSEERRGSAYGTFHMIFGFAWFAGSALLGFLYDTSLIWLTAFSVIAQLCSLPFLFMISSQSRKGTEKHKG